MTLHLARKKTTPRDPRSTRPEPQRPAGPQQGRLRGPGAPSACPATCCPSGRREDGPSGHTGWNRRWRGVGAAARRARPRRQHRGQRRAAAPAPAPGTATRVPHGTPCGNSHHRPSTSPRQGKVGMCSLVPKYMGRTCSPSNTYTAEKKTHPFWSSQAPKDSVLLTKGFEGSPVLLPTTKRPQHPHASGCPPRTSHLPATGNVLLSSQPSIPRRNQTGTAQSCTPSAKRQMSLLKGTFLN